MLVGCAADSEPTTTTPTPKTGTIILSVNPSVAIEYDEAGKVNTVRSVNDDGQKIVEGYVEFENKDASIVVREVVDRINQAGYLVEEVEGEGRQITIEIEKGSTIPHDKFIDEIGKSVKDYLNEAKLKNKIRLPREDDSNYDDLTDYKDSDYDLKQEIPVQDTDYQETDYDDSNYDDSNYSDYGTTDDVTDYDESDYQDTNYSEHDDSNYDDTTNDVSDYDDTNYDDSNDDVSDYDDSDYDDSDYDN